MKRERQWWRNDLTGPQKKALRLLRDRKSYVYAIDLVGVGLPTLRALHRHGLVSSNTDVIQTNSRITVTQSGRDSIADEGADAN